MENFNPATPELKELTLAEKLGQAYGEAPVPGLTLLLANYAGIDVELASLKANPKNVGQGTAGMQRLTTLADVLGINLMLVVGGLPGTEKFDRLVNFYQRFGFTLDSSDDIMRREKQARNFQ